MNAIRVWAIAHNVFRETVRDRVLYLILLYLVLMIGAGAILPGLALGGNRKVILDIGLAGLNLLTLVVAVFLGTGLIRKEIEKRTVYVMIAKPMSRVEFIVGKHLGLATLLSLLVIAMGAILIGQVLLQFNSVPLEPLLLAILFIYIELLLIVAAALLFGSFTSAILATLYTFALYTLGHFSPSLLQLSDLMESPVTRRALQFLYLIVPNLERLNLKNMLVEGQLPGAGVGLLQDGIYGILYTLLLLSIASLIFSRRQF